jgi:hypothetical protein
MRGACLLPHTPTTSPQHQALRSAFKPHEWMPPLLMASHSLPPDTATGLVRMMTVLSPS